MIRIYDLHYELLYGYRNVIWGDVYDHPRFENGTRVHVSTPVELDRKSLEFKTVSGSHYQIMSFLTQNGQTQESILDQIEKDISNGEYSIVEY